MNPFLPLLIALASNVFLIYLCVTETKSFKTHYREELLRFFKYVKIMELDQDAIDSMYKNMTDYATLLETNKRLKKTIKRYNLDPVEMLLEEL